MSSTLLIPTLNFTEISSSDLGKIGRKSINLSNLVKAKIPVPNGFVITTDSYFYFLDMARLREKILDMLSNLDTENYKEIQEVSNVIQDIIIKSTMPPIVENSILKSYSKLSGFTNATVVVKSSLVSDSALLQSDTTATFLNIKGGKDLILAVKACWASLFDPELIHKRGKNGISQMKYGSSVIIQKMIQQEVSGVFFTSDPVFSSKISIEAVYGLPDLMSNGSITPDHYEINKESLKLEVKRVSKQTQMLVRPVKYKENENQISKVDVASKWQNAQKVDDKKIIELAKIGRFLEQILKQPQEVEWAIERGKIYIIQVNNSNSDTDLIRADIQLSASQDLADNQAQNIIPESEFADHDLLHLDDEKNNIENIGLKSDTPTHVANEPGILSGSPASEGIAEGRVKVIYNNNDFSKLNAGDILVIDKVVPDDILWIRKAAAIITKEGGMSSHAAILSREFKIPCIVGIENVMQLMTDNQRVQVNGSTGRIYIKNNVDDPIPQSKYIETNIPGLNQNDSIENINPNFQIQVVPEQTESPSDLQSPLMNEVVMDKPEDRVASEQEKKDLTDIIYHNSVRTATNIIYNINIPDTLGPDVQSSLTENVMDGVGYIDGTDILNKAIKKHPETFIESENISAYINSVASILENFCSNTSLRQIIYRPSNLISSELTFDPGIYEQKEENPRLGYYGATKYIQNPSLFNLEIEVIKTVRNKLGYKNLSLMLPMIRDTKDLREIKKIITSNDLKRSSSFKIYLPIESPSSILIINELLEVGIDGVFIFARKLSSLLNSVDPENKKYSSFNVFNEAFMIGAEIIIKTAHKENIPSGVILEDGEFDEKSLKEIIGWGAIYLSIDPFYYEKTKLAVSEIEKSIILSRRK